MDDDGYWWATPEPVLLRIFWLLPVQDIANVAGVCRRWRNIANDDLMWRKKFRQHFKADKSIALKPGAESWKSEYGRLTTRIPYVQSQCLVGHVHQVLHVSFSHNGEMFATCSKDGYVIIWNSGHPCTEKYSHNMKHFSWKYTQYSQFNQCDELLLVSGVHFGSPHCTSGEIAVFTVDNAHESHLRCRVVNRPYDIFGTWFTDQYLISGDLHWLAHLVSTSVLWVNKANQETKSEHVPVMNHLYKFYNKNASSVRSVMLAKCPWLNGENDPLREAEEQTAAAALAASKILSAEVSPSTSGNPLSHTATLRSSRSGNLEGGDSQSEVLLDIAEQGSSASVTAAESAHNPLRGPGDTIRYSEEYRRDDKASDTPAEAAVDDEALKKDNADEVDEMENSIPKYLIFSLGARTYTPHQIGFKRLRNITFPKKLDPGLSLKERIAAKKAETEAERNEPRVDPDWWNYDAVADRFDRVDRIIDLHGHIIGMALSPDHRYLYVNTRPWPENYTITNALEPPPIAQEIDIHVIDLMTLTRVGNMLRAHKAYTPSSECFFIFLDVCADYVASGAEDKHAYIWDRYYGICLAKYKHTDVVNSVAFNPRDPEMMVTTSDDYSIKIWRSRNKARELNLETTKDTVAEELRTDGQADDKMEKTEKT